MAKIVKSISINEEPLKYVSEFQEKYNLSFSSALESIISEHRVLSGEGNKERVLADIEKKYKGTNLKIGYIEKNIGIILEILNSLLYSPELSSMIFVGSDQQKNPLLMEAEDTVIRRIERQKQIKDNRRKKDSYE